MNKHKKNKMHRTLGKLKKVKTWQKGLHKSGGILTSAGKITVLAGTATGQPEIAAAGAGMIVGGKAASETSKILKHTEK